MQTKVVIFDFDGTLTISKSSTWARIWDKLNAKEVDEKYYLMFKAGEIDYNTWLKICFEEFKARGYTEKDLNELVASMKLINDIDYVFDYFKKHNIKIYILSGGIKTIIERVLGKMAEYLTNIEASNFLFEGGQLSAFIPPMMNPENKQEYVNHIIKSLKVDPKEVVFVGNGKNDETVYLTGANTLCLNPDGADFSNKKIWHNYVETQTLKDILPFITCQKENLSL